MTGHTVERRLAAILAADIVGFSRMMGSDEAGTLNAWKHCRSHHIDPTIRNHRGRIFKTMGDGILAEFPSVVDAVRCAVEIQRGMQEKGVNAPKYGMTLRVAINLGDVMIDGEDVYGDGVNVAARLQSMAAPGGILVSEKVKAECAGKLDVSFVDGGQRILKNIANPIRIFWIRSSEFVPPRSPPWRWLQPRWLAAAGALLLLSGATLWQIGLINVSMDKTAKLDGSSSRLSVMVLPFANLGGDASQDWFADGVTESVTASLSQVPDSFVIARSTAFTYKGRPLDPKQIGREVGVRYLLQGSVLRSGERMRVNVALISTDTARQIWSESFDHEVKELIDLENQISARVARSLDIKLRQAESRRTGEERPNDPTAMDLVMQGQAILYRTAVTQAEMRDARLLLERAVARDDKIWSAWIALAESYLRFSRFSPTRSEDLEAASKAVARALALAPGNGRVEAVRGFLMFEQGRLEEAISVFERAISLDRNYAPAYAQIGAAKMLVGQPEETFRYVDQAIRLSPFDARVGSFFLIRGIAHLHLGQSEQALKMLEKAVSADPEAPFNILFHAAALADVGRSEEAERRMREFRMRVPNMTLNAFKAREVSNDPIFLKQRQRIYAAMLKAGLPE